MNAVTMITLIGFLSVSCLCYARSLDYIDLVMIVDATSALAALTAIESIMMKSQADSRSRLRLNVVANNGSSINSNSDEDTESFIKDFVQSLACFFEDTNSELLKVVPFRVDSLVPLDLQVECSSKKHICARFYVPIIFPHLNRYIYLDNDVLVTCDIKELWVSGIVPLVQFEEHPSMPSRDDKSRQSHYHRIRDGTSMDGVQIDKSSLQPTFRHTVIQRPKEHDNTKSGSRQSRRLSRSTQILPVVSFVWEHHPVYTSYIKGNFNTSHPLVAVTLKRRDLKLFFNAGVALVNAGTWRRRNVTAILERLLRDNLTEKMFNFAGAGDQAIFYLMEDESLGAIPHARFNMRRLPKKTVQLLNAGINGVIHWAGTTGVNTEHLCLNPNQYPLLHDTGAIAVFMKVVESLDKRCPDSLFTYSSECLKLMKT